MLTNKWIRPRSGLAILFLSVTLAGSAQKQEANAWKVIGPGGGGTTYDPTISPHDSRLVVESSDMTGNYITRDNGLSWRMFNLRESVAAFAFDPTDPRVIYAANAALWRSSDSGSTWKMVFPDPSRGTVEHLIGDRANYSVTTSDPAYPGGDITAMAILSATGRGERQGKPERIYLAFQPNGHSSLLDADSTARVNTAVIVTSADGGITWNRLASLPHSVLLLAAQGDGVIAVCASGVWHVAAGGAATLMGNATTAFRAVSAAHFADAVWIYATGQDGEVYLSEDSGAQWRTITPQLQQSSGRFQAIAASDRNPRCAYVGFRGLQLGPGQENLYNGIARTSDGGHTWKVVFKESNHAATNLSGSWIEGRAVQDAPAIWDKGFSIWFDTPYSLGVSPINPDVAYATDLFRTYRTLDGGATWQEMNSRKGENGDWISRGLDVTTNYGLQFDPFDSRHIYIDNTDIGLFQSADGGLSWRGSTEGVPEDWRNTTYWLAFDPARRGLIWGAFSGTHDLPHPKMWRGRGTGQFTGGVAVSTDGGDHWRSSNSGLPQDSVTHILLDPSSPVGGRTLYACAFGRGVYKSTDNGLSWTQKNAGIEGEKPLAWRITAAPDRTLYLVVSRRSEGKDRSASGAGALYKSVDAAEHWQRMNLPPGVTGPTGLEVDPRDPSHLYLTAWGQMGDSADQNGGMFASDDCGRTWRALFTQAQHVYDVTIDPAQPDTLYFTGSDTAAYRSTDRGMHWERISGYDFKQGNRIFLDPNHRGQIYITTYGGGVWHGPAAGDPYAPQTILTPVPVAHE